MEFETSDLETAPALPTWATRVADVTVDTQTFLSSKFAARSHNNDRLDTRNAYTLPRVQETRKKPNLEVRVLSQAKALDNQLQSFVLDVVAPWFQTLLCHQTLR